MKRVLLTLFMVLCFTQLVLASSVTRSFSDTTLNPGETLNVTLNVVVDGGDSVVTFDEKFPSTSWTVLYNAGLITDQPGHLKYLCIDSLGCTPKNISFTYSLEVPNEIGTHNFSGEYGFEFVPVTNILGQTQVTVNSNATSNQTVTNQTDDLMVNYIRGKITIDNVNANASTVYQVRVLNGANSGYTYNGIVDDSNIIGLLKNNGYFDTGDKIGFSTGASFVVSVAGLNNCIANGIFENGGNGDFNTQSGLVNLNCTTINNAPVLGSIGNKQVNENATLIFSVNATDIDNNALSYFATGLPSGAVFSSQLFSWTPNYTQAGAYEVKFNVTDGRDWDSETITITINNVNRVPVLQEIVNQTILEDTSGSVLANAADPDNDALIYTITAENVSEVDCSVKNNNITFTPASNWHGNASCKVNVSDGSLTDSKTFYIEVTSVNDAPVLSGISNIVVSEGGLIKIIAVANDVDRDSLTYNIDNTRFTNSNGNFTWQTNYTDEGVYYVNISVSDGTLTDSQIVKITVNNVNEPPHINPIANITINEDSGFVNDILISATDNDGTIVNYVVSNENINEVDCSVSDSKLGVKPTKDFSGTASCVIKVYDNEGASDETTVYIIVNNINDAPEIISYSPNFNPLIASASTYDFSITWRDIDNTDAEIIVKWYKDGVEVGLGKNYAFSDGATSSFNITVIVSDGVMSTSKEWTLTTSNSPIANTFNGNTTNFTGMNDTELASVYLILERVGIGKIEFLEPVDVRGFINLDAYANIINSIIGIDSTQLVNLKNRLAKITFYNLNFAKTPTIYYYPGFTTNPGMITQVCPDSICLNVSYVNNDLTFYVNSFSSFRVGDAEACSQQGGDICGANEVCGGGFLVAGDNNFCCATACTRVFSDVETCEIKNSNIEISIKDPNNNENFDIDEIIGVKVKIKNKFDEKLEFDVKVDLYDIEEDESIEDEKENVKIKSGKSETVELEIKIPDDVESNDFAIYVYVEDDEDRCNSDYVLIEIERQDNDLRIKESLLNPILAYPGGNIDVFVDVENQGSNDEEDIYFTVKNNELGIYVKEGPFEIEEYGEDDTLTKTLRVQIPVNAKEGEYSFDIGVEGKESEDSVQRNFNIFLRKQTTTERIVLREPTNIGRVILIEPTTTGRIVLREPINTGMVILREPATTGRIIQTDFDTAGINVRIEKDFTKEERTTVGILSPKTTYVETDSNLLIIDLVLIFLIGIIVILIIIKRS